jgi:hypothetical protein
VISEQDIINTNTSAIAVHEEKTGTVTQAGQPLLL